MLRYGVSQSNNLLLQWERKESSVTFTLYKVTIPYSRKFTFFFGVCLWHSGLRIWHCHCSSLACCCGVGQSLAQELPHVAGIANKNKKTQNMKKKESLLFFSYSMGRPKVIFIIIRERPCSSGIYFNVPVKCGSVLRYMTDQEIHDKFLFFKFHLN